MKPPAGPGNPLWDFPSVLCVVVNAVCTGLLPHHPTLSTKKGNTPTDTFNSQMNKMKLNYLKEVCVELAPCLQMLHTKERAGREGSETPMSESCLPFPGLWCPPQGWGRPSWGCTTCLSATTPNKSTTKPLLPNTKGARPALEGP